MKRILVVGAAVLLLAGCAAPAAEEGASPEAGSAESAAAEGASGEGAVVGFPVGWPEKEVPLLPGTILAFAHPGNVWATWVQSEDLVADLATASQLLIDAGYTQTLAADGYAEFSNPDRVLRIVASVDGTWGSSLQYTFTDGAVEAADAVEQDQQQQQQGGGEE